MADLRDETSEVERILRITRDQAVEFIHLQFIDIPGTIKGLSVPADRLASCFSEGVWFDGSSVEGFARLAESDLYLRPDAATFAVVPWERPTTARLLCDLATPDGQPFLADPRYVLKRALADAQDLGYRFRVSAEVEFYLLEERDPADSAGPLRRSSNQRPLVPSDTRSYFELTDERAARLCQSVVKVLRSFGVPVAATHHEVSPGQHEVDLAVDDALRIADAIVTLKLAVRALAMREGLLPTFMPKPLAQASGSGLHIGQVLTNLSGDANAFFDPLGEHQLSALGQSFVAGQLAHARGMTAIVAPLVNSYKRLLGGAEAPATVDWARVNRNAFVRVPWATTPEACQIELRAPDVSCNPYLALATMLQAGLDGVRNRTPLSAPAEEGQSDASANESLSRDSLPSTLGEALEELQWDMTVRQALGQPVYERFAIAKEQEWLAYRNHISSWEIESYLESA
jgi:glutamine synthetase